MGSVWTRRTTTAVVALVAAVVLVRLALVLAVTAADDHRADSGDKSSYVNPARSLLHDGQFDRAEGSSVPEFLRTPGYPAFLAAVYGVSAESDTAVYAVQAVLSGLSVFLAVVLGRRLAGSWPVGLAAGVLVAIDPVQAATQGFVGTEGLATVLVTLAVYTGVRFAQSGLAPRWGAAYALALVAATYVRPATFYFAALPALILGVTALRDPGRRRAVVRGGLALLVPCVVLQGAWNVRNQAEVGSWRFSAVESVNLYWYRAAGVVAERDGIGFDEARAELTDDLNDDVTELDGYRVVRFDRDAYTSGQLPPAWEHRQGAYYERAQRAGLDVLRSEPVLTTRQAVKGVYSQLVQSGWVSAFDYLTGDEPPAPVRLAGLLEVWTVEALAALGMVAALGRGAGAEPGRESHASPDEGAAARGRQRVAHALTVALIAYTIAVGAGPEAADGARFRTPLWPLWCIYAALGARALVTWWRGRRPPPEAPVVADG
jgi:hypothetical protein